MLRILPLSAVLVLLLSACSHSTVQEAPTLPALSAASMESRGASGRTLWGIWDVTVSADRSSVEVAPMRGLDLHLNTVRFLEVTPCQTCLTVSDLSPIPPDKFQVDVTLTHPFPGLVKYTGFDVRGVFISQADYAFPPTERSIAWGDGGPKLVDFDGYTSLYNPTEFPPTNPPALGYIPGKKATGGDLTSTLNPFIAYKKDAPRRMFEAGSAETKTVTIQAPAGALHFGYAVDASWHPTDNVIDPVTDFPISANCIEAYQITIESGTVATNGEPKMIGVKAMDHQGLDTIVSVTAYSPQLFDGGVTFSLYPETGNPYALYIGSISDSLGAGPGVYPLLVRVVDAEGDPNLGQIDAWQVCSVEVALISKNGWVRTWGGPKDDFMHSVSIDDTANVIVAGEFRDTVDFDPGPGIDNHKSEGDRDAFLLKFDSSGGFLWARTWGGPSEDCADSATDNLGNIYVTGTFMGKVDFDPGPGECYHTDKEGHDYLSKFDPGGNFLWVQILGSGSNWVGFGGRVSVDGQGNPCVRGQFGETADFDPGPGVDNHTSNGSWDAFVSKFDSNGSFQWAVTWGGPGDDVFDGRISFDPSGNVYYYDLYNGTMDFDPGPGEDKHTCMSAWVDSYLSIFGPAGDYKGMKTWDADYYYLPCGPYFDGGGNMYMIQDFAGTWDMDPGLGIDNHVSNGQYDACLSKFDSSGNFLWAKSWGGSGTDVTGYMGVDGSDNIYVEGVFEGTVDFDPGPGSDYHMSIGQLGEYLGKYGPNGDLIWVRTWGTPEENQGGMLAVDGAGDAYIGGDFTGLADFDPGIEVEYRISNGGYDCFLTKFPPDGNW